MSLVADRLISSFITPNRRTSPVSRPGRSTRARPGESLGWAEKVAVPGQPQIGPPDIMRPWECFRRVNGQRSLAALSGRGIPFAKLKHEDGGMMDPATRRRHARPSLADRARHAKRRGQNSRWPALDGLRAFAVLTVMAAHLNDPTLFPGGGLGVDVFFVISGFLITSILLGEQDKRGRVGFGAFYARRALRLFPALVVVLAVVAVVCATDSHIFLAHETLAGIPWIVLYAGNWLRAFSHAASLGVLGHTWSLAVEEQFYLIWPVIFVFGIGRIGDRRRAAALLVSAALAVMAYRAVVLAHGWSINRVSNGSDTHCDGLLLGCALALWLTSGAEVVMPRVSAVL